MNTQTVSLEDLKLVAFEAELAVTRARWTVDAAAIAYNEAPSRKNIGARNKCRAARLALGRAQEACSVAMIAAGLV